MEEVSGRMVHSDPVKVSAVLGDPTRLGIYQYVLKAAEPVTTQEVAQRFSLHPNVARMHLTKLVDLGLLLAEPEKGGRGRPGMLYSPSGQAVNLSYPTRDFQLLSELLSETIGALGEAAKPVLEKVGRDFGRRLVRQTLAESGVDPAAASPAEILQLSTQALDSHGLDLRVGSDGQRTLHLTLKSCGFREVASKHPQLVCHLCHQIVQGVLETQAEIEGLHATGSLPHGDKCCTFEANVEFDDELIVFATDAPPTDK